MTYIKITPHTSVRWLWNPKMVDIRSLYPPPGHEITHRRNTHDGRRVNLLKVDKKNLKSRSSTDAELVGVNGILLQVLWTHYFLEAQRYGVEDSTVYQDNLSTMMLGKTGRASSSKRTRHINIRFFLSRIKFGAVKSPSSMS